MSRVQKLALIVTNSSKTRRILFDRLIDAQQKRFRDFEPEGLGRCQLRAPQRRARGGRGGKRRRMWCCQTAPKSIYLDRYRSRGASRSDWVGSHMLLEGKIRRFSGAVFGARITISALAVGAFIPTSTAAQTGEPLKIGYSMALSGGLGPNGRSALLAQKIWEEDTNAKGGLLGRPVKLIYYDDQTNPATVPGIYAKLLDVDKVDLIIGAYGTNMLAPAMPVAMQRKKMFIGLLGLAVNSTFNYPNYFSMAPSGPDPKASRSEERRVG